MRSTSPRRVRKSVIASSRDSSATRSASQSVAGRVGDDLVTVRTRPAARRTPRTSRVRRRRPARAPSPRRSRAASAHSAGAGPAHADVGVEVARVDAAAGVDAHAAGELHRDLAAQVVDRRPALGRRSRITVAASRGSTGSRRPVGVLLGHLDQVVRQRGPAGSGSSRVRSHSSTMTSTSTGASSGSTATPTADRACTPASPKTVPNSSEAPLATLG